MKLRTVSKLIINAEYMENTNLIGRRKVIVITEDYITFELGISLMDFNEETASRIVGELHIRGILTASNYIRFVELQPARCVVCIGVMDETFDVVPLGIESPESFIDY